jgi:hypothetical protein
LALWISGNDNLKIERIVQDINFWKFEMEPKLVQFYSIECILPELVDPRHTRNMKIRDPPYILQAIKDKQKEIRNYFFSFGFSGNTI